MPPDEVRSPSSFILTRRRSLSILIGSFCSGSDTSGRVPSCGGHPAADDLRRPHAHRRRGDPRRRVDRRGRGVPSAPVVRRQSIQPGGGGGLLAPHRGEVHGPPVRLPERSRRRRGRSARHRCCARSPRGSAHRRAARRDRLLVRSRGGPADRRRADLRPRRHRPTPHDDGGARAEPADAGPHTRDTTSSATRTRSLRSSPAGTTPPSRWSSRPTTSSPARWTRPQPAPSTG